MPEDARRPVITSKSMSLGEALNVASFACAAQYVQEQGGGIRNLGTLSTGKLNLLLHDLRSARMQAGDVIAEPGLVDPAGRLLSYDRVIANPPFSLKNWGHGFAPSDPHHRFDRYGAISPKTKGDTSPSCCTCWG